MRDDLPFRVHREVLIHARPDVVFSFLSDPQRFADWWGTGSSIEPTPGGAVRIVYPNGQTADGQVIEVESERRMVFTYGYDRPDGPIPVGGSVVEFDLEPVDAGTRVRLTHHVATAEVRDLHGPGWRYQLGLFAAAVCRVQVGQHLHMRLDAYLAAWNEPEAPARRARLREVVSDGVSLTDGMACVRGRDDLDAWIAQSRQHMAGTTLTRDGDPAAAGDLVLWNWVLSGPDGTPRARGRNVARFDLDGRMAAITGFWLETGPGLPSAVVSETVTSV